MLSKVDQAIGEAKDANDKALELSLAGKDAEASSLFTEKCYKMMEKIFQSVEGLDDFRQKSMREIGTS